jgi:hypothetical protein
MPPQSAFIGTSISLKSFRDEFGLPYATPADLTKLGVLSANIVSTYREFGDSTFDWFLALTTVLSLLRRLQREDALSVLLPDTLSVTTSDESGVCSSLPSSSLSELFFNVSLLARPDWVSCTLGVSSLESVSGLLVT